MNRNLEILYTNCFSFVLYFNKNNLPLLCRKYDPDKFWFLKDTDDITQGQEATDFLSTTSSTLKKDELALIKINNILIKIESGIGNNTIPLLLLESSLDCNVRDFWSNKRMTLMGSVNLEMAYYNAKLALWEPVIEPIVTHYKPDGSALTKRSVKLPKRD